MPLGSTPPTGNVPLRTPQQLRAANDAQLFAKIAEEASEVIKAVMKHAQFGARPHAGDIQYDNVDDTILEFAQLSDAMNEYVRRFG